MRTRLFISATIAALTLTACGGGTDSADKAPTAANKAGATTNPDQAAITRELAQAIQPNPGQYETRVQVTNFEVPGMPADQAAMAQQMMTAATAATRSACVTAEQAATRGRDMFREMGNGECTVETFDVTGPALTGRMRCTNPQRATAVMTMNGTFGTEASEMNITADVEDPSMPQGRMTMTMRVNTRRTGDCAE